MNKRNSFPKPDQTTYNYLRKKIILNLATSKEETIS